MRFPLFIKREDRIPTAVASYLLPHEHTVIAVHRHPAIFIVPIGILVAFCLSAGVLTAFVISGNPVGLGLVWGACFVVLLYPLVLAVAWQRSYFAVTKARMILIGGVATRTVTTLPVANITDLTLTRSSTGRVLGYGNLIIKVAGAAAMPISYVPYPEQLFEEIREVLQLGDYAEDDREPER